MLFQLNNNNDESMGLIMVHRLTDNNKDQHATIAYAWSHFWNSDDDEFEFYDTQDVESFCEWFNATKDGKDFEVYSVFVDEVYP